MSDNRFDFHQVRTDGRNQKQYNILHYYRDITFPLLMVYGTGCSYQPIIQN